MDINKIGEEDAKIMDRCRKFKPSDFEKALERTYYATRDWEAGDKETSEVQSWEEELKELELEDANGCLVYHQAVKSLIRETIISEREQAVKEERERLLKALPKELTVYRDDKQNYVNYTASEYNKCLEEVKKIILTN